MNKLIKGAITGAAGIALLLGGAGSFAAWNSQATIAAGPVKTGTLGITATSSTAVWTDVTTNTTLTSAQLASYVFAPGDHLQLKESVVITATGNNLQASLGAVTPTLTDTTGTAASAFTVATAFDTADAVPTNGATLAPAGANSYTVTTSGGAAGQITVPVTVDITLNSTATNSNESATVNLTSIGIDLTQTNPAAASPVPAPTS